MLATMPKTANGTTAMIQCNILISESKKSSTRSPTVPRGRARSWRSAIPKAPAMKITPITFPSSPSGPSRLFGTFSRKRASGLALLEASSCGDGGVRPAPCPGWITFATVSPTVIATNVFSKSNRGSLPASGPPRFVVMNVWTIAARINAGASAPSRRNTSFPGTANNAARSPNSSPVMIPSTRAMMMRP